MTKENVVKKLVYQKDGSFRLFDSLGDPLEESDAGAYPLGNCPVEDLTYFAASVIWRASICIGLETRLGPYEESFRRYLLGEAEHPREAELMLSVLPPVAEGELLTASRMFTFPKTTRRHRCHLNEFALCGLIFSYWIGGQIPEFVRRRGIMGGTESIISVSDHAHLLAIIGQPFRKPS